MKGLKTYITYLMRWCKTKFKNNCCFGFEAFETFWLSVENHSVYLSKWRYFGCFSTVKNITLWQIDGQNSQLEFWFWCHKSRLVKQNRKGMKSSVNLEKHNMEV